MTRLIQSRHQLFLSFINVRLEDNLLSTILLLTDAEDRATLESDPSAVIGDDVALGRVIRLCPDSSLTPATLSQRR